jgi:hypothetical protein
VTRRLLLLRGLNIYSGPPSLVGLCRLSPLFNSQYSIKVAFVTPKSNSNGLHQHQPKNIRSSRQELSCSTKPSITSLLLSENVCCRSTSYVEHRPSSHKSNQDDSRTPSSCQPSTLDPALRLFHTRRPQRCFRSLGLTATYQGSQDPYRSEGRDACSSSIAD